MRNLRNITRPALVLTLRLFVLLTSTLAASSGEPIRNDSDPICSDSFDLDSNVQQVMITDNSFVARQVDKGLKSAARDLTEKRLSLGTEIPLAFSSSPLIRSKAFS